MTAILSNTGYFVGIGIEVFIILICGALLALMLTGLLFTWLARSSESRLVKAEARAASAEARAVIEEELAAQAAAEAEAERARMEAEALVKAEAEAAAAEAAAVAAAKQAEEEAKNKPKLQAVEQKVVEEKVAEEAQPAEKEAVKERIVEKVVIVEQQKAPEPAPQVVEQPAPEVQEAAVTEDEEEGENGFVVVQDGIVFNDSKTITELYEELSAEQQSYFDELREEALTKPDAELAIAKNFVTVKIGKRNLIKLLIKRGVTVAEFMLENEALKQLRLSNTNKRGKSSIKVKPTVVQVLDLTSLKVAVDMINLAYEELMLGD